MADADTELLATMMLEGTVTVPDDVPDDDTIPTTETVQPEGDTECPGQAEGSLDDENLASSSSEDSQEEHTIGKTRDVHARVDDALVVYQAFVCRAWSAWRAGEGVDVKILQVILYRPRRWYKQLLDSNYSILDTR